MTTNPSIFQKALSDGAAYDEQVRDLALRGTDVGEAVRALTTYDVRWACDVMREVYDRTDGVDGRVSIEVDPRIAHDTDRTVAEAKALWWLVDRPNLYIKIPATKAGLPAITAVLAEGISVNVTLIFSLERYDAVMDAFLAGLEQAQGQRPRPVAAGLGRVVLRQPRRHRDRRAAAGRTRRCAGRPRSPTPGWPTSTTRSVFAGGRWKALEADGAKPQRPLWASTGVKDPAYDDTQYVVELVAPRAPSTPCPRRRSRPSPTTGRCAATPSPAPTTTRSRLLDDLAAAGISYDDVVETLEREGVAKFERGLERAHRVGHRAAREGRRRHHAGRRRLARRVTAPASASPEATATVTPDRPMTAGRSTAPHAAGGRP